MYCSWVVPGCWATWYWKAAGMLAVGSTLPTSRGPLASGVALVACAQMSVLGTIPTSAYWPVPLFASWLTCWVSQVPMST